MILDERYKKYEISKKYDVIDDNSVKDIELTFQSIIRNQHKEKLMIKLDMDDFCTNTSQNILIKPIFRERFIYYHSHSYYEINYIFSGKMYQYINGQMYSFGPQSLVFLSPQANHSLYVDKECYGLNILISKSFFHRNENVMSCQSNDNYLSRLSNKTSHISIDTSPFPAASALFRMTSEFQHKATPFFSPANNYLEKMLEHILFALHFAITEQILSPVFENDISISQESSDKVFDYIKNNLADVSLESTAKHFGYSAMSIHRIIKAQTGSNFTTYVSKQRINIAKFLLKNTNLSIKEIASQLGFSTTNYFCSFFKKQTNQTAAHYRKEPHKILVKDTSS